MIKRDEYIGDLCSGLENIPIMTFTTDTEAERDAEVARLGAEGWAAWLIGNESGTDKPAAVMYKPPK